MSKGQKPIAADIERTKQLTDHLVAAYEQFVNEHQEIAYVDGFMAAHNFHCVIIFHLEKEGGFDAAAAREFRRMAAATLQERLRREPLPGGRTNGHTPEYRWPWRRFKARVHARLADAKTGRTEEWRLLAATEVTAAEMADDYERVIAELREQLDAVAQLRIAATNRHAEAVKLQIDYERDSLDAYDDGEHESAVRQSLE